MSEPVSGGIYRNEDWYGDELVDATYEGCTFSDVDLTEATTKGVVFRECTFHNCRFNASTHVSTAFIAADFRRCNFFDVTLEGCKLDGSVFAECTMRPMKVIGGSWRSVTLRGANLGGLDLGNLDLRESDLSMSDLTAAVLRDAQLDGATVRETNLTKADLRGASLGGVDLREATLKDTRLDLPGAVHLAELYGRRRRALRPSGQPSACGWFRNHRWPNGSMKTATRPAGGLSSGPRAITVPVAVTRAAAASQSSTVRCRVTAAPRSGAGTAMPWSSNSSDIIQRAPATSSSQCPTRPSSMMIGS